MKNIFPTHIPLIACLLSAFILFSCRTNRQTLMTESLYMQYKRVNIDYPFGEGQPGKDKVLSEVVSYTQAPDTASADYALGDSVRLDTNRVYRLDEVKVEVRSIFTPERNGHVAVDFLIRVPKELISPTWCMTLTPLLLDRDSVISMQDAVLHGQDFRSFQEDGYEAYRTYEQSIIHPDQYDETFLDREGIAKDIRLRQLYFLNIYKTEWERRKAYRQWKTRIDTRIRHFNLKKETGRSRLYHQYSRQAEFLKVKHMVMGLDTAGVSSRYARKFEKRAGLFSRYRLHREPNAKSVPGKYRDLYRAGEGSPAIANHSLSEKDSVSIAKDRYFFDAIAANEMKERLKEETLRQLVPFPYREDVKLDTLFRETFDFFYLYSHKYPVTPGLKKLRVVLKGRVDATDLSGYTLPDSDTLTYIVSSIDELTDTTLIYKGSGSAHGEYRRDYAEALLLMEHRNYASALEILEKYTDYNTALCLTSMGHKENAWQLLVQLEQTANVRYLSAIVLYQLGRKQEAAVHLIEACTADPDKIYRISKDAELKTLVREYNLQGKLNELEYNSM